MDQKVLQNLSYGLFVLTAHRDGKDSGCMINTAMQLTSNPLMVSIAVNKDNFTCEMIRDTRKFTISILSQDATFDLVKRFGFQSGRNVDKFDGFNAVKSLPNGTKAVTEGTNAYISVDVINQIDLESHILFIGTPTDGEILSNVPSATYAYYFSDIKPKPEKVEKTKTGETIWRCKVCGYEYVGEELPEDFICPVCKHPASDFEKVE